mgnify:CR=1 FL=1
MVKNYSEIWYGSAGALDFNKWTNIVISNSKKVFFLLQIVGIYIIENVLYFQSSEKGIKITEKVLTFPFFL